MAYKKVGVEFELKYKEAAKNATELGKIVNQQGEEIKNLQGNLDDLKKSTDKSSKGFKSFGVAIKNIGKTTGIVYLVVKAFDILKETFGQNQQVVNIFNIGMEALSLAFNDFFKFINDNVGTIVGYFKKIFSDPKQAVYDFATAIYENLTERFNSLLDTLGFLASAVKKVFEGDFAGALEAVKSAGKEAVDVITGVPDTFDKIVEVAPSVIKGITEYGKSTLKAAQETVELNRAAEVGIAQNRIILEQKDREAEKLRQIRDDESKTIAQRISANNKLAKVLDEQEKLMLANADAVIASAQAQYNKNKNDENYIALLDARAEREGILAQIEGLRSEQLVNINSLERERIDNQKTIAELLADELTPMEELQKQQEAAMAELELLHATEEEKQQLREKYAKLENELTKQTQIENAQIVTQALGQIASLMGEQTAFGKAVAVAQATIDTYVGANKALAQGGIFGAIGAAGIIASGIANVRTILATETPSAPSGGGSAPSTPSAPSFNVVGAAPENQLAQTIGEQEQKPVKAFVVSQEVSSQQALDRNIESSASLG
jgi:hypothetical protein